MTNLIKPTNVLKYVDLSKYSQINSSNITYQLPRIVNQLLKVIGDDVVIKGLDVDATLDGSTLNVTVQPGMLLQDATLIELQDTTALDLQDIGLFDEDGKFVIYAQYQYLNTVRINPLRLGIAHVSQTGHVDRGWNHDKNRTVLTYFDFTKENDVITSITESTADYVIIEGREYYRYGLSIQNINLSRYMEYFTKKFTQDSGSGDPSSDPLPSIVEGDLTVTDGLEVGGEFAVTGSDAVFSKGLVVSDELKAYGTFRHEGDRFLINATDVEYADPIIHLNRNELGDGITRTHPILGNFAGIKAGRGLQPAAVLGFDETDDTWKVGLEGGELTALDLSGSVITEHSHNISDIEGLSVYFLNNFEENWAYKTLDDIKDGIVNKHFTQELLDKLDNIEERANNYVHPALHTPHIINQDTDHRFVTDAQIEEWSSSIDILQWLQDNLNPETIQNILNLIQSAIENGDIPQEVLSQILNMSQVVIQDSEHRFVTDVQIAQWSHNSIDIIQWLQDNLTNETIQDILNFIQSAISNDYISPELISEIISLSQTMIQDESHQFVTEEQILGLTGVIEFIQQIQSYLNEESILNILNSVKLGIEENTFPPAILEQATNILQIVIEDANHKFVTEQQIANWNAKLDAFSEIDDTMHGSRSGGTLHTNATITTSGFMSSEDKEKLDNLESSVPFVFDDTIHSIRGGGNLHAAVTTTDAGFMTSEDKLQLDQLWSTKDDLQTATDTTLGGVKVGTGLQITLDGILSTTSESLPPATNTILGGVKIGDGVNVDADGTISVVQHPPTHPATIIVEDTTHKFVTDDQIADWNNKLDNTNFDDDAHGIRSGGNLHSIATIADPGFMSIDQVDQLQQLWISKGTYELSPATTENMGGVIIGDGLDVDQNGNINVNIGTITTDIDHRFVTEAQIDTWNNNTSIVIPFNRLAYVDITRDDLYTENGTQSYPYKTIQAAITAIEYGIIYLAPGTYNETLSFKCGINLIGIDPNNTIIDGSVNVLTDTSNLNYSSSFKNIKILGYVTLEEQTNTIMKTTSITETLSLKSEATILGSNLTLTSYSNENVITLIDGAKANLSLTYINTDATITPAITLQQNSIITLNNCEVKTAESTCITVETLSNIILNSTPVINQSGANSIQINSDKISSLSSVLYTGDIICNTTPVKIHDVISNTGNNIIGTNLIYQTSEQIQIDVTSKGISSRVLQPAIEEIIDRIDGVFDNLTLVTTTDAGLMSANDKIKLNNIDEDANNYIHPSKHYPTTIIQDTDHRFVTDEQISLWDNNTGNPVEVYDTGELKTSNLNKINFVGDGATVTTVGDMLTVNISCCGSTPPVSEVIGYNTGIAIVQDVTTTMRNIAAPTSEGNPYYVGDWIIPTKQTTIRESIISYVTSDACTFTSNETTFEAVITNPDGSIIASNITSPISGNTIQISNNITIKIDNWTDTGDGTFIGNVTVMYYLNDILPDGGRFSILITHHNGVYSDFTKEQNDIFYDTTILPSASIGNIDLTSGIINSNKWISGLRYFDNGDTVLININDIDNINTLTYLDTVMYIDASDYGIVPFNVSASDITNWDIFYNTNDLTYSIEKSINQSNFTTVNDIAKVGVKTLDWLDSEYIYSAQDKILINTNQNTGTPIAEEFDDEYFRITQELQSWDSTNPLGETDLMVIGGVLKRQYGDWTSYLPNTTANYSAVNNSDQYYIRSFKHDGVSHYNGILNIGGVSEAQISNKDVEISISLDGSSWLICNDVDYYGDTLYDGDGCRINHTTVTLPNLEFTLGGGYTDVNTGPDGWGLYVKIKMPANSSIELEHIRITNWI